MPKLNNISAVVLTRNEQENIESCLRTIGWCDEVILIDNSVDRTVELANKTIPPEKLKVHVVKMDDDFSKLRNLGLQKARNEWVLFVDADHRVPHALRDEIRRELTTETVPYAGFRIRQMDKFEGQLLKHGETAQITHILLARKSSGSWKRRVHEYWEIGGKVKTLVNPIYHLPHPSIGEFVEHINRWSSLDARTFLEGGQKPQLWKVLAYPVGKFVQNYVFRLGLLDGFPGLAMAFLMSLHSLCVRVKMMEAN